MRLRQQYSLASLCYAVLGVAVPLSLPLPWQIAVGVIGGLLVPFAFTEVGLSERLILLWIGFLIILNTPPPPGVDDDAGGPGVLVLLLVVFAAGGATLGFFVGLLAGLSGFILDYLRIRQETPQVTPRKIKLASHEL